ncbi:hypothetical protein Scep_017003 [Stephania cephalantha]|uniref:Uncharacterized protein n=1 Tax=Stephania cephalantha TaxID=152367 RepID=A0AAP0IP90_9MAGN
MEAMTDQEEAAAGGEARSDRREGYQKRRQRRFARAGGGGQAAAAAKRRRKDVRDHNESHQGSNDRRQDEAAAAQQTASGGGTSESATRSHLKVQTTGGIRTTEGGRPMFKASDGRWRRSPEKRNAGGFEGDGRLGCLGGVCGFASNIHFMFEAGNRGVTSGHMEIVTRGHVFHRVG